MVRPLNKEWKLFGNKYRVAGAKCAKVDCKACQAQVSAAINRLQSHIRVCPARFASTTSPEDTGSNTGDCSSTTLSDAIPTSSELTKHSLEDIVSSSIPTEQAAATSDAPPAKRQRQSPSNARDRPRWNTPATNVTITTNDDDLWNDSAAEGSTMAAQPATLNHRRLEIEEKRLRLDIKKDQREERRERLELEILEAQARKEKLLVVKEGYEAKVLLALSRKQLFDQGVDGDEVDRILPISSSCDSQDRSSNASTEVPPAHDHAQNL